MNAPDKLNELHQADLPNPRPPRQTRLHLRAHEVLAVKRRNERELLVKPRLRKALLRLNPWMTMKLPGYGACIPSGLTDPNLDVFQDAFLPGRNLLFLLAGASFAYSRNAIAVAIGLLSERNAIFPDQTAGFISAAQEVLALSLGREIALVTPLMTMVKADVLQLARERGLTGTYSCHAGQSIPCGRCVSCKEIEAATALLKEASDGG